MVRSFVIKINSELQIYSVVNWLADPFFIFWVIFTPHPNVLTYSTAHPILLPMSTAHPFPFIFQLTVTDQGKIGITYQNLKIKK